MKYLKYLLYLLLLPVLVFLFILVYGTLSDYRPPEQTLLYENPDATPLEDSLFSILIWNIGYGGLSNEMDFFYDGGQAVMPSRDRSEENLAAVNKVLQTLDSCDFILLNEVDIKSKRSYRINQLESIGKSTGKSYVDFGKNFDVFFNPVPPRKPLGKLHSGIATLSDLEPASSIRFSFPGNYSWPMGSFMLDRCFVLNRYPLDEGKDLIVINTHNSAYDDGSLRKAQMDYLRNYLMEEYKKGNFVIVGGDWNQTPFGFEPEFAKDVFDRQQLTYIDKDYLPDDWTWLYDPSVPTNRRVDIPYEEGVSRTTVIDFYLLSPNLVPISVQGLDLRFENSDHQPVLASFRVL